jgi:2-polyprenyl-3-methyl-5-hydroxy-6-metoxy-1,4-benzoquinol methylase
VETGADYHRLQLHGPWLLRAAGDVKGLRVLDLGCGQGFFSRRLATLGAKVTGVDWSRNQIENARRHEKERPLGIEYRRMDARNVDKIWPEGTFDLLFSCMALMDMPEPGPVLKSASRVLKPSGRLVASISHPCFNSPPVSLWTRERIGKHGPRIIDRYFDEGPVLQDWVLRGTGQKLNAPAWHRTLSTWFSIVKEAGFVITDLWEPQPTAEQVRKHPGFEGVSRVPFYLVFEAKPVSA